MRFHLQSLVMITVAAAVFFLYLQSPVAVFALMLFGLPILIALVGLTAPQKGAVLDVESQSGFVPLVKLWLMLIAILMGFTVLRWTSAPLNNVVENYRWNKNQTIAVTVVIPLSLTSWERNEQFEEPITDHLEQRGGKLTGSYGVVDPKGFEHHEIKLQLPSRARLVDLAKLLVERGAPPETELIHSSQRDLSDEQTQRLSDLVDQTQN